MTRKKPRPSVRVQIVQPAELATAVDKARGKVPRSRWINERCAEAVGLPVERLRGVGKPKKT